MNILVGGLFSAVCYRWPFIGLALLMAVAGFVYCNVSQNPVEQACLMQDWSPTVIKEAPPSMSWSGNTFFSGEQSVPVSRNLPVAGLRQT